MRKTFVVIFILLSATPTFAGKEGGNGGGLSEKLIILANSYISRYIDFYLSSSSTLRIKDKALLIAMRDSDKEEKKNPSPILFFSGKAYPRLFLIDGSVRIAKTGDHVGDSILINTDLIYSKDSAGNETPLSLPMAITILVHELGHHHHEMNHEYLDSLATSVANSFREKVLEVKKLTADGPMTASYLYHYGLYYPLNRLIIMNRTELLSIDDGIRNLGSICSSGESPQNVYFTNMSWSNHDEAGKNALLINAKIICGPALESKMLRLEIPNPFPIHFSPFFEAIDCDLNSSRCW